MTDVWMVVYDNAYEPQEPAEVYDNEAAATEHAAKLGGAWTVERWSVSSTCVI
jgi:hypothetical protein